MYNCESRKHARKTTDSKNPFDSDYPLPARCEFVADREYLSIFVRKKHLPVSLWPVMEETSEVPLRRISSATGISRHGESLESSSNVLDYVVVVVVDDDEGTVSVSDGEHLVTSDPADSSTITRCSFTRKRILRWPLSNANVSLCRKKYVYSACEQQVTRLSLLRRWESSPSVPRSRKQRFGWW